MVVFWSIRYLQLHNLVDAVSIDTIHNYIIISSSIVQELGSRYYAIYGIQLKAQKDGDIMQ